MEIVLLIIIVVIVYNAVIKRKKNVESNVQRSSTGMRTGKVSVPTPGYNNCPADALINSPYYAQYKATFDYIWYNGQQPKYKIDWLLKSLDMGRELEAGGVYVVESIKKDLPYFCETEVELDRLFESDGPAMKGSVKGILDLGYFYHEVNKDYFLQEKRDYWKHRLIEMAQCGNLEAQAALCANRGLFEEEEVNAFKEKYETEIMRLANEGNPYAQLGVGLFLTKYKSREFFSWMEKAAIQGLSDAYYYMGKGYESFIYSDEDFNMREKPLEGDELKAINAKTSECYIKGANTKNGIMAERCQLICASNYEDGSNGFPKNVPLARSWYKMAAENGNEYAASMVDVIDKYLR